MIVRTTAEITGTDRDVAAESWRSKRIILAGDGVGFSFHETTIEASSVHDFHYQHHVEACGSSRAPAP
jgi:L-ectoine synthase